MNSKDEKWLEEIFPQYKGRTVRGEVLTAYYEAERILNGWDKTKRRGCSCELRSLANSVNKLYENWQRQR